MNKSSRLTEITRKHRADVVNQEKDLICGICYEANTDSKQCRTCQHIFCKKCIDKWLKEKKFCPFKCSNPMILKELNSLTLTIIQNFKKICPNDWCQKEIKLDLYDDHLLTCKQNEEEQNRAQQERLNITNQRPGRLLIQRGQSTQSKDVQIDLERQSRISNLQVSNQTQQQQRANTVEMNPQNQRQQSLLHQENQHYSKLQDNYYELSLHYEKQKLKKQMYKKDKKKLELQIEEEKKKYKKLELQKTQAAKKFQEEKKLNEKTILTLRQNLKKQQKLFTDVKLEKEEIENNFGQDLNQQAVYYEKQIKQLDMENQELKSYSNQFAQHEYIRPQQRFRISHYQNRNKLKLSSSSSDSNEDED